MCCVQVYSVLGLLMVGTFNLERDRLFEQQVGSWPAANTNPSFHGVVEPGQHDLIPRVHDPNLDWPQHGDNDIHMHTMSNDELKEYEKRKSKLKLILLILDPRCVRTGADHVGVRHLRLRQLPGLALPPGGGQAGEAVAAAALGRLELPQSHHVADGSPLRPQQGDP